MVARPGLYAELVKRNLMDKARHILLAKAPDFVKADCLQSLLWRARSEFEVSPRAVFIVRHKLKEMAEIGIAPNGAAQPPASTRETNSKAKRNRGAPIGNQNAKGNNGGGAPLGNDNATTTGEYRNPLLHW